MKHYLEKVVCFCLCQNITTTIVILKGSCISAIMFWFWSSQPVDLWSLKEKSHYRVWWGFLVPFLGRVSLCLCVPEAETAKGGACGTWLSGEWALMLYSCTRHSAWAWLASGMEKEQWNTGGGGGTNHVDITSNLGNCQTWPTSRSIACIWWQCSSSGKYSPLPGAKESMLRVCALDWLAGLSHGEAAQHRDKIEHSKGSEMLGDSVFGFLDTSILWKFYVHLLKKDMVLALRGADLWFPGDWSLKLVYYFFFQC